MTYRMPIFDRMRACLLAVVGCLLLAVGADAASAGHPDFAAVAQALDDYFASLPDHQPRDLITQSQVKQALDLVADVGWDVPGRDGVVDRAMADGSFLARELATPAGRKFMRNVSRHPGTYGRLDRLSSISGGKQVVRDLVHRQGGHELVEYLATTRGGHNLGRMLADTRNGVDLNKPTGRIYTADDLVAALKAVYQEAAP